MSEGQHRSTALGRLRRKTSEVVEVVEPLCPLLATRGLFSLIRDRVETIRLAWDHGFHPLFLKHPPHRCPRLSP